jgi:hypothetical protein
MACGTCIVAARQQTIFLTAPLQAQHYIRVAVSPTKSSLQVATGRRGKRLRWHINCNSALD